MPSQWSLICNLEQAPLAYKMCKSFNKYFVNNEKTLRYQLIHIPSLLIIMLKNKNWHSIYIQVFKRLIYLCELHVFLSVYASFLITILDACDNKSFKWQLKNKHIWSYVLAIHTHTHTHIYAILISFHIPYTPIYTCPAFSSPKTWKLFASNISKSTKKTLQNKKK